MAESSKKRVNPKRTGRSLQRQRALDVLFEADTKDLSGSELAGLLDERRTLSTTQQPIGEYGQSIVRHFVDNADDVDSMIEAASPAWAIDRMSLVDRNLLRIGATEHMFMDVDLPIVIKEVTGLAREFSDEKSIGFTMGVLNRIAEIRGEETAGR